MKNNLLTLLGLMLACFLIGCQQNTDEVPSSIITPELAQSSGKDSFLSKINDLVSSSDVQNQIAEPLGDVHFEYLTYFESDSKAHVALLPIYTESSKMLDGLLVVVQDRNFQLQIKLLTRGLMYNYKVLDGYSPPLYVLASIFTSYDQMLFENNSTTVEEIIGWPNNDQPIASRKSIEIETDVSNVKLGWVEIRTCEFEINYAWDGEGNYLGSDIAGQVCSYEYLWESTAGAPILLDQGGSGGGNGSYVPRRIEDHIDDSKLKPCLQAVLADVKGLTKGVSHMINKFAGLNQGYNWEMVDARLAQGTGETSSVYNSATGTVTSKFDAQNWKNATDISWARTILHESVHAYLVAFYNTNRQAFLGTYPQMVNDWATYSNWNRVHHEEFSRSLTQDIADALQEFGTNKGYGNLSRQFYEDMAWAGLQGTTAFDKLPPSDQQRILDTNSIELTKSDLNGTAKSQKGNGAGC